MKFLINWLRNSLIVFLGILGIGCGIILTGSFVSWSIPDFDEIFNDPVFWIGVRIVILISLVMGLVITEDSWSDE